MDNAGGGIRGLRARISDALIQRIEGAYNCVADERPVDLGGSSNLNLLLVTDDGPLVARVYRPYVTAERLRDIQQVRRLVDRAAVPCGGLLRTTAGEAWIRFEDRLVEVERFVERDADMDTWTALATGMPVLARMHDALAKAKVSAAGSTPLFANYIAPHDSQATTRRGTDRTRQWHPSAEELEVAADAERLARAVSDLERPLLGQFPQQLGHGDFWDNNVFFRQGEVVFLTDFDFMGNRWRIDDLALTIYFMCMEDVQQPVSDSQLQTIRGLLDAYDSATEQPLTIDERIALPAAIARQPLWSIGVWVALLDDERVARDHAAGSRDEIAWALRLVDDIPRWQEACR